MLIRNVYINRHFLVCRVRSARTKSLESMAWLLRITERYLQFNQLLIRLVKAPAKKKAVPRRLRKLWQEEGSCEEETH